MKRRSFLTSSVAVSILAACGTKDVILPGERLALRDGLATAEQAVAANQAKPIQLPAAQTNANWTHRFGSPSHRVQHPALGSQLALAFAVNIGEGNSRRARITADPVIDGGVVYTLDARGLVSAVAQTGGLIWQKDVSPKNDNSSSASGGGIAVGGGRVFVATGYGALTGLDAATGAVVWQQDLDAPGGSAPTVLGETVYLVGRDSRAWAIDVANGRIRWQLDGTPSTANFGGGAGAAVTPTLAVFPFPSGEVMGAFPLGGLRRWSSVVSGQRLGHAGGTISDISGDPVIDGNRVYAANISGRVVALDLETGNRIWTASEGSPGPVWPEGGSVFLINDVNELLRLDAADGTAIWRVELPKFEESRERRQKTFFAHYGPIVAGGRVIVASSDGALRQFDPASGALVGQTDLPGGAASNPAIAGGVLYVVSGRGQLLAFR